ncbi:MAG: glutamine-hydrolyzing carbamoyl-phosphate synthase small subunit [Spirochaetaceae bacterium]|jgi:carbamoyl-phosphate synthase small subunit|nr:glutamine-hydrolyzing carbamoyl-phosphate synthase small subunit [Spirochaetaceae bacterium]
MGTQKAQLILEDGSAFGGVLFGKIRPAAGEVVFTTGMTGYPQALTDPSFCGQILVATYPLIGNYGVPLKQNGEPFFDERGIPLHFESDRVQVSAFVVAENCTEPSHFASGSSLAGWLEKNGIPALCGVDTRAITVRLRERGVMRGKIVVDGCPEPGREDGIVSRPVPEVSCKDIVRYTAAAPEAGGTGADGKRPQIVLIDCGAKANILRCLLARGVDVIRVPWDYDVTALPYHGLFLSNGPGDPKSCGKTIAALRRAFSRGKPIFGICLGAQLMALAAGADTYKLPYGHRSANQPCVEAGTGRCYITSQNHGYAVRAETLPEDWEVWFTNANDGTVEGIRSKTAPFSAVQFHPEGCPGPRDTEFLIDRFLDLVRGQVS